MRFSLLTPPLGFRPSPPSTFQIPHPSLSQSQSQSHPGHTLAYSTRSSASQDSAYWPHGSSLSHSTETMHAPAPHAPAPHALAASQGHYEPAPQPPPLAHQPHYEAQLRQEQYERGLARARPEYQGYGGQEGYELAQSHSQSQSQSHWAEREGGAVTWADGEAHARF